MAQVVSTPSPWFPTQQSSTEEPSSITTNSRSNLFGSRPRPTARDADHYEMHPTDLPWDAPEFELQDDSFMNFSVGNLDRRNFSRLGVSKYVRSSARSSGASPGASPRRSAGTDSESSGERVGWRRRRTRRVTRKKGVPCFRP